MPAIKVQRSIRIDAPVEKIYKTVSDLHEWKTWSPWLIMEPEARVTVNDDGKFYKWEGKRVGVGEMKVTSENENKHVDYDLTFLKPWKSTAKVRFTMHGHDDHSHVNWIMESKLPFYMFWMKNMMEAFVGMDYERGLRLLKDYVEDGTIHSILDFKGPAAFNGTSYIGIRTSGNMDSMSTNMRNDFERLWKFVKDKQANPSGAALTIYHKWNPVKNLVEYTAAIPLSELPQQLPAGVVAGTIPSTPAYILRHTGSYEQLGNAWGTLYSMQRNKEIKVNKKIDPFEVYVNYPGEVPNNDLVTDIYFPTK